MQQFYSLQMSLEPRLYRLRKHGDTIVRAFPIMYRKLVVGNIDIFHPEAHTFHQAQTSSIQQTGHEMRHAVEVGQHARDFLSGEHHRHVSRSFCALNLPQFWEILLEHSAIEKDEGI